MCSCSFLTCLHFRVSVDLKNGSDSYNGTAALKHRDVYSTEPDQADFDHLLACQGQGWSQLCLRSQELGPRS